MTNRAMSMNHASAHSVCTAEPAVHSAYMYAACYFSVLRFYFYYFTNDDSSKRQQIS